MAEQQSSEDAQQCLLQSAGNGDEQSWSELTEHHRDRLRRMIALRMDLRLQSRIDASDVLQEALLEAWTRLPEYVDKPDMPFFLWLRFLTGQKLVTLHRQHLGTKIRDAAREISRFRSALPEASSAAIAAQLLGNDPRPSELAVQREMKQALHAALDQMDPDDREVIALRHFEQLSRAETAQILGLNESATSKRYIRALAKLKKILLQMPVLQDFVGDLFN